MQIAKKLLSVFMAALLVLGTAAVGGAGLALTAGAANEAVLFAGSGTQDAPYEIGSDADWQALAQFVADGGATAGKFFRQTADVTASVSVGSEPKPFRGRYDGAGKTLKAALIGTGFFVAPFCCINGATIENLRVTGTVNGARHCSGLVGAIGGTDNLIRNCLVEASITTSGTHCGGFVGHSGTSAARIEGCVFAGSIYGGVHVGGIWGWSDSDASVSIVNCLENGKEYAVQNLNPIALGSANSKTTGIIEHVTPQIGNPDRSWTGYTWQAYKIKSGNSVSIDFGNVKYGYDVSGLSVINAYLMEYGGVGYAKANNTVTLTPSFTGAFSVNPVRFFASAGTLTDNQLAMPAQDVTINAVLDTVNTSKSIQLALLGMPNIRGAQQSKIWFGNYKQSSDGNGGYNVDPIKWRVLSNTNGSPLLLSDQNLDVYKYHDTDVGVTWEKSDMRKWLNGTGTYAENSFRGSAFTEAEFGAVALTELENAANPDYSSPGGSNTADKVFLPSIADVTNTAYGFQGDLKSSNSRKSTNTAYVAGGGSIGKEGMYSAGSEDIWWLRTPGMDGRESYVTSYGLVETTGNVVTSTGVTVRPALQMDPAKVLFTSAAVGGKQGGNLANVGSYSGSDWKLTVLDDSRAGFTAYCFKDDNGMRTIKYDGAKTGENEKITAMIVDSSGAVTFYGALTDAKAGRNTVMFSASGKLSSGDKLYILNEQLNGDKKTDYASVPQDVTALQVDVPTFSPDAGSHTGRQTVTFSCDTAGATIYYTTDGSEPSETNGTQYTSPVTVDKTMTVKAKAFKNGVKPSVTVTAEYQISFAVQVSVGANMTITSGTDRQFVPSGSSMTDVVCTAASGYYFPADYAVASKNGINVTRDSWTQLTVSGTPTDNTPVMLTAPTAKTKEKTPTATFTATGSDTGTLDGLTAGMTYSINGGAAVTAKSTSVTLTGLAPCTITVVKPGNGTTTFGSDPQTINVTRAAAPALEAVQPETVDGTGSIPTTSAHQKSTDGVNWTDCDGAWTGLAAGTYYVRVKAAGTVLASDPQTIAVVEPIIITGLTVKKQPNKTVYTYRNDKDLDLAGLELEAICSDGSVKAVDPSACKFTGYSAKPVGDKTITVEYEGQTAQFKVTVKYTWWQWLIRIFLLGFIWY